MQSDIHIGMGGSDGISFSKQEFVKPLHSAQSTENKSTGESLPILGEKTIIDAIERANKIMEINNRQFQFSIHEKTKHIMIKEVNIQTKEIIREIPAEKILDMVAKMCELAGLFIDEKK